VSRPVGRVLCLAFPRGGGHPSRTAVAGSLVRSTRGHRAGSPQTLAQAPKGPLDLAPGGVYQAAAVTCGSGGLLHHRFTITARPKPEAVCFLWHYPAGHPGSALPTTLPCGARTFLTGPRGPARPPGRLTRTKNTVPRAQDGAATATRDGNGAKRPVGLSHHPFGIPGVGRGADGGRGAGLGRRRASGCASGAGAWRRRRPPPRSCPR
jgi:hypothetical protein